MNRPTWKVLTAFCLTALATPLAAEESALLRPNIVVMLADDLGFGELQCLNPTRGKIPTPRLDAIAASGMIFTDAHSGSSVCTPTRYGLMTGRYAFRTRLQSGVLTGGESLIAADRLTVAKLLHLQGYHTAIIGKWHLGMLFDGKKIEDAVPVGARVTHGPIDRGGFDEFHGFHHARQIETWIDNDQVTATIKPVEMLPRLAQTAVEFVRSRKDQTVPFFLYIPWSSPHSPVVPSDQWKGKSGLNEHADFVMQTDDAFGQVIDALKANGLYDNTLVICSADNGTSAPTSKMSQLQQLGHFPSGDLRGSKADIWDGGHRVPFLVSWPAVVKSGSRTDQLVCLTDVMSTLADLLNVDLPANAAEDSVSFLPVLEGKAIEPRTPVIHHSISGYFAIRDGVWKLACCPGSGGWTAPKPGPAWKQVAAGKLLPLQLYNLSDDLGETNNLATDMPDKVAELRGELDRIIDNGRSTPGPAQANDAKIDVEKRP
ncbi:arylsulfatase [Blastopirellula sp. JC732]|uniref:Arylsulfatase n=1 Tax=Blastopirellula sediminis TaxID=2894196 RepID=A0A9X1MRC5_9BACT|nr:arylsulfatase [Blastopirellula sediminis]MCC9605446.1 arylsulfatase [Blastopirellula sediminis]MCC9631254.1 arylsulfatase [Blastopirellula sediminis]